MQIAYNYSKLELCIHKSIMWPLQLFLSFKEIVLFIIYIVNITNIFISIERTSLWSYSTSINKQEETWNFVVSVCCEIDLSIFQELSWLQLIEKKNIRFKRTLKPQNSFNLRKWLFFFVQIVNRINWTIRKIWLFSFAASNYIHE